MSVLIALIVRAMKTVHWRKTMHVKTVSVKMVFVVLKMPLVGALKITMLPENMSR